MPNGRDQDLKMKGFEDMVVFVITIALYKKKTNIDFSFDRIQKLLGELTLFLFYIF